MVSEQTNPRQHYEDPIILRNDSSLTLEERRRLLERWKDMLEERLTAESEGMGAPAPMSAEIEGRLADEEKKVSNALIEIQAELASKKK